MIPRPCEESSRSNTPRRRRISVNHEDRGHWGDLLRRNKGESVRVLLHNTGGIGFMTEVRSKESLKSENCGCYVMSTR